MQTEQDVSRIGYKPLEGRNRVVKQDVYRPNEEG
jgi:hypothetical protein